MIDLSTLTIPSADVVPEPTAEDIEVFSRLAWDRRFRDDKYRMPGLNDRSLIRLCSAFARRCRELEATRAAPQLAIGFADARIAELEAVYAQCVADGRRMSKQLDEAKPNPAIEWQADRINELEAEVERLAGLLIESQSEASVLRETARAQQTGEWSATALINHPAMISALAEVESLRKVLIRIDSLCEQADCCGCSNSTEADNSMHDSCCPVYFRSVCAEVLYD